MKSLFLSLIITLTTPFVFAQDDLSALFNDSTHQEKEHVPVYATFKSPRIINARSNETIKRHELDFSIAHRFGDAAGKYGGLKTFFGTDAASDIRMAFDYGITDNLTVGISRSKGATAIRQLYEGSLKYKLVQQMENNTSPIGITLFANAVYAGMISNVNPLVPDHFDTFADRWSFTSQAIIVRKFSPVFSLAFLPTFIHYNRVSYGDENNTFALGIAGRLKISKRMALIADYFYSFRTKASQDYFTANGMPFYNPLGVGIEIETGGHVFQLTFMNSTALLENQFVPYTTTSWATGQYRWGFSFSRTFALGKRKMSEKQ